MGRILGVGATSWRLDEGAFLTRVLLILESPTATNAIATVLRSNSAIVDEVDTGTEGIKLTRHYDCDIVIVSLTLRDMDGAEVVRRMRDAQDDTRVLALADVRHKQGSISAFGAGADDVTSTPLNTAEFLARLRAIVRRSNGYSQSALRVGGLVLNIDSREVSIDAGACRAATNAFAVWHSCGGAVATAPCSRWSLLRSVPRIVGLSHSR